MSLTIVSKKQQQQRQKSFAHIDNDNTLVFNLNGNRNHGIKNLRKKVTNDAFTNNSPLEFPSLGKNIQQKQPKQPIKQTKSWNVVASELSSSGASMTIPYAPPRRETPQTIKDKRRSNETKKVKCHIVFEEDGNLKNTKTHKQEKEKEKEKEEEKENQDHLNFTICDDEFPTITNKHIHKANSNSVTQSWSAVASTPKQPDNLQLIEDKEVIEETPPEEEPEPFVINIRRRKKCATNNNMDDEQHHVDIRQEQNVTTFTDWGNVPSNWGDDDDDWQKSSTTWW